MIIIGEFITREPPTIKHTISMIWLANAYNGEFYAMVPTSCSYGRTILEVIDRNMFHR